MSEKANGWRNGILPAVLAALPAGSVYAYPYFSGAFQAICSASPSACSWIFSASIFFLGMGAAFFGPVVEKNPRKSLLLAAVLYLAGMSVSAAGLLSGSYWTVFAGYGVLNGVGQGIAYLSPVKAAMSWFPKRKGLAGASSIVAFGLGSAAAIAVSRAVSGLGCAWTFAVFAVLFPAMIALAASAQESGFGRGAGFPARVGVRDVFQAGVRVRVVFHVPEHPGRARRHREFG